MIDLDALERRLDVAPYAIFGPELRQVIARLRLAEAVCELEEDDCGDCDLCDALAAWRSAKEGDGG